MHCAPFRVCRDLRFFCYISFTRRARSVSASEEKESAAAPVLPDSFRAKNRAIEIYQYIKISIYF